MVSLPSLQRSFVALLASEQATKSPGRVLEAGAPTVCMHAVSGSISLPSRGSFRLSPDADAVLSPPSAPLNSPSKIHGLSIRMLPSSGPPSPKSPVGSPRNNSHGHSVLLPTSPKRLSAMSPRQCKTASHYLYAIRQKLPIILRAITIDDSALGSENADSISLAMEGLGGAGGMLRRVM